MNASQGVCIKGIKTVEYDACGISKAKHQIQQEPREFKNEPGIQLAIDFHDTGEDDKKKKKK